jgi:hypothetical protein
MTGPTELKARHRLNQAKRLWLRALASYADVDALCIEVNSLIQSLRSVTWLLQKDLRHADGFNAWYAGKQETMRTDPVLRWLVEARNQIEKQGDLELRSTARVSVIASWLPAPFDEIDVPPLLSPAAIAYIVSSRQIPQTIRNEGVLKVERRWVTEGLPDLELLEGCAHAYAEIDALLSEAEAHFVESRAGHSWVRLTWPRETMVAGAEARSAYLHLGAGDILQLHETAIKQEDESAAQARYGDLSFGIPRAGTFEARVEGYHAIGRRLLEVDGHHNAMAFLLRRGVRVSTRIIAIADQQEKYLMLEAIANDVLAWGADEVILQSETWIALLLPENDPQAPLRAGDRTDRGEAFVTEGVSRRNGPLTLITLVERHGRRLFLSPAQRDTTMPQILLPIRRAWEKAGNTE